MLAMTEILKLLTVLIEMVLILLTCASISGGDGQIPLTITKPIRSSGGKFGFKGIKTMDQSEVTMAAEESQLFFDLIIPLAEIAE